ncbi:unnamed protein product [Gongylonema pulchrum]|uniref:WD_REPEATS_REGION domain-containing protein n=1 Tax=Gongylonema pulchrum TaxID=637853 RepID=A0A183E4W3_9BILA|nr:unnamed protein product [Gongylonema pulchrum]
MASRIRSLPVLLYDRELGRNGPLRKQSEFLECTDRSIYQKDVKGHFGCVNAIEASPDECLLASGGDDRRVLLWTVADVQVKEKPMPVAIMKQTHQSNIFSLAFSNKR